MNVISKKSAYSLTEEEAKLVKEAQDKIIELQKENDVLKKDIITILKLVQKFTKNSKIDRKKLITELKNVLRKSAERELAYQKLNKDYRYLKGLKQKNRNFFEPFVGAGYGMSFYDSRFNQGVIITGGLQMNFTFISDGLGLVIDASYNINQPVARIWIKYEF